MSDLILVILFLGAVHMIGKVGDSWKENIKSNKDFIIENATYKCTKTNELKQGEEDENTQKL